LINNSCFKFYFMMVLMQLAACGGASPPGWPELTNAPYQPDSGNLMVRCGSLIDGRSDHVSRDVDVLIRDGHFVRIGPELDNPDGVPVFDLGAYTCLPGLIEMHAHILESFEELVDLTLYYDYSHDDYME
jgi:hypothetical protein